MHGEGKMQVAIVDNDMEFAKKAEVVIGDFCSDFLYTATAA